MPFPLATLIPFIPLIAEGINSGINMGVQSSQNTKQNTFNKQMADYAYSKEVDMYNKANEYNLPKNQMQRLEDAGLNKALMYQQGQPGNAVSSMPKYQDVKGTFGLPKVNIPSQIDTYQNYALKKEQTNLLQEQIKSVQADTDIKILQKDAQLYDNINKFNTNKFKWPQTEQQLNELNAKGYKSGIEYDLQAKQTKQLSAQQILTNLATQNRIQNQGLKIGAQDLKSKELKNTWETKKQYIYDQTNVNIDKDDLLSRVVAEIFGTTIKKASDIMKHLIP